MFEIVLRDKETTLRWQGAHLTRDYLNLLQFLAVIVRRRTWRGADVVEGRPTGGWGYYRAKLGHLPVRRRQKHKIGTTNTIELEVRGTGLEEKGGGGGKKERKK